MRSHITARNSIFSLFLSLIVIISLAFSSATPQAVHAQDGDGLKRHVNASSGRISFIGPEGGKALLASRAPGLSNPPEDPGMALARRFGPEFGLKNPGQELAQTDKKQDKNGKVKVKYQQMYQNVPVMGGELIVNTNGAGDLYSINGEISPGLTLSTEPGITPDQARQAALEAMGKWHEKSPDEFAATEPELWIYDESLLQPSTRPVELVWRMEVTAKDAGLPVRELVLVNAQRGSISLHFNQVDTTWGASTQTEDNVLPTSMLDTPAPSQNILSVAESTHSQAADLSGTWYVATTGSNANTCSTPDLPCATINGAMGRALSGDTIKVAVGLYKDSIIAYTSDQVVWINKSITLSGGWNEGFTAQSGTSTVDGEGVRKGIRVFAGSGTLNATVERFTVQNGYDFSMGGGIDNSYTLTINQSNIMGNKVGNPCCTGGGGGAGISNSGTMIVKDSTVAYNTIVGGFFGSAIWNDGNTTIENSTISDNSGDDAIYNSPRGLLTFNNSTISFNTGGIKNLNSGTIGNIKIGNSILAKNEGDCAGQLTSLGHNLIGNGYGCTLSGMEGDLIGSNTSPIDPRLNPLHDNGGFTFTRALAFGSPAIDSGNPAACLPTDQRGMARPVGLTCDMGAYEGSVAWEPSALASTYTANMSSSLPGTLLCNQDQQPCTANNANPHANGAHQYAIGTYNFYASKHNRDSINNNGMKIISTVQYCSSSYACPYDNAFWSGEQMVYGSANGYPMADDVVAHELTHGVTQYESNLFYYYQSGAINESFSDLWGEYYDQANGMGNDATEVKWLLGEDVSGLSAIRSMSNPLSYGDPDKMSSPYYYTGWEDNYGVHSNSGVNNKAVHLMVDGGAFNTKTVAALGWDKVSSIYYEANTNLLTSAADYSDLYYALQQACLILVGQKGITAGDCLEVKDAADAVEMNSQPLSSYNPEAPLCAGGFAPQIIFADDLENGADNWTFNNGAYPRWQIDSPDFGPYPQSGAHSLYADDVPATVTDATAKLVPILIPANAYLHFAQAWELDADSYGNNYDGGVLEYSTNSGVSWNDAAGLMDYNGYNGTISSGYYNPLSGRRAFVDTSHGYISTRLNLASLAGQTVNFRWRMGLDQVIHGLGWWVDNVKVYTCAAQSVISGNVGAGGIVLKYTDGTLKMVVSQPNGSYSFQVPGHWSGTVTPLSQCYSFSPASRSYTNVTTDMVNQDYTGTLSAPCVLSIVRADNNPAMPGDVHFIVTFTKPVTGVNATDFIVSSTRARAASITSVTGSGTTYSVTVNTGIGGGAVWLDLRDDDSIKDDSDRPLGGQGQGNGNYTSGERYDILTGGDTTGVFRPSNGFIYLKNVNTTGYADMALNYGIGGDYPIAGDWNGDGIDSIGVYRNGVFYLRNSNTIGYADTYFAFGTPGDQPVAGDWDGDGIDTIGVYNSKTITFYLRNSNSAGPADYTFRLGIPGDIGIAGDWTGKGYDTVGVFRPSNGVIFLKNTNQTGYADIAINYGIGGDKPVTGDWNNDGVDSIGVLRGNIFYLRNSNTIGYADMYFALGIPGDMPIAGNWDGKP